MKTPHSLHTLAFSAAVIAIATFAGMDVLMKGLSLELGAFNAMFWRSMPSACFSGILFFWSRSRWPTREIIQLHIWRGFIISVFAFLFFWGLKYLPLAEAVSLSFIAPLIALYLAKLLLNEIIGQKAILASMIGLLGALVIIAGRLGGEYNEEVGKGIMAILFSAVLYAYNLILQRQQALVASPFEIAFFQNGTILILFSCLAPFWATIPTFSIVPSILGAAVLGLVSLLLMSWAYARAPANRLIPVEYTAFAWAALFGWLVFGETVTITTIIGTVLIVFGCLITAWQHPEHVEHVETTTV
jgi:S-adenosylmethionine uptake transporter